MKVGYGEFRAKVMKTTLVLHIETSKLDQFRRDVQVMVMDPSTPQSVKDFLFDAYGYVKDKE